MNQLISFCFHQPDQYVNITSAIHVYCMPGVRFTVHLNLTDNIYFSLDVCNSLVTRASVTRVLAVYFHRTELKH